MNVKQAKRKIRRHTKRRETRDFKEIKRKANKELVSIGHYMPMCYVTNTLAERLKKYYESRGFMVYISYSKNGDVERIGIQLP